MRLTDLPLPRPEKQLWALFHEESPKNNPVLSYGPMMELFNVTGTFRQESHYPITTQYLRNMNQLQSQTYVKTVEQKNRYVDYFQNFRKKLSGLKSMINNHRLASDQSQASIDMTFPYG